MSTQTDFDSIIFDMDGTLWDAVDSYCAIWNESFRRMGIERRVSRDELLSMMGKPLDVIASHICHGIDMDTERFCSILRKVDTELMPQLGGTLYSHVAEDLKALSKRYRLLMVSNCGPDGLRMFLDYTGLRPYFTDTLTHGETSLPKEDNISLLIDRHGLERPVYVGDIQGDADSTHRAGLPFIWAAYGFGTVSDAEYRIDCFHDLIEKILNKDQTTR